MKILKIYIFIFLIKNIFCTNAFEIKDNIINLNLLDEKDLIKVNSIKIAFSYSNDFLINDPILEEVFKCLIIGDQLSLKKLKDEDIKNREIKKILSNLEINGIPFYISFFENNENIIWKLYDVNLKIFLTGKKYIKSEKYKKNSVIKLICKDIWQSIFGGNITPFENSLSFLVNDNSEFRSKIININPFIKEINENILLKTKRNLVGFDYLNTKPNKSMIFYEMTYKNERIIKLNKSGYFVSLIDLPGNSTNLISNEDGVWYVRSGKIYRYYYDKEKKKLIHFHLKELDKNEDSISINLIEGPNKTILFIQDYKVYSVQYEIDLNNKFILKNKKQISDIKSRAAGISYNNNFDLIVISEKINNFYQLVSYNKNFLDRKILTKNNSNKISPAISPCGNYVAYIVYEDFNKKRIEMVNIYTEKILKIVNLLRDYISICWN